MSHQVLECCLSSVSLGGTAQTPLGTTVLGTASGVAVGRPEMAQPQAQGLPGHLGTQTVRESYGWESEVCSIPFQRSPKGCDCLAEGFFIRWDHYLLSPHLKPGPRGTPRPVSSV